ncbi:MAG TPA: MFS transporter [Amycolatopsis sp.]|nr:MFS transporter [Amycolatopsis sp.]
MTETTVEIGNEHDVVAFVERGHTTSTRLRWIWLLALGGVFFEAYTSAALGTGLGPLTDQLHLSAGEVSLLAGSSMLVSIAFGPVAGILADRFGRVPMLVTAKGVALVSAVLTAFAPDYAVLLSGRALAGVAWGLDFATVMAYLAEFLPTRHRGRLNRWQGIWYVATTANLLITLAIYEAGAGQGIWRWSLGSAGVLAIVLGVAQTLVLSESPQWLAGRGRLSDAARALRVIYGVAARATRPDTTPEAPAEAPAEGAPSGKPGLSALFRAPYRPRTLLSVITFYAQGLEYFAIGWYLPVISLQLFGDRFAAATLGSALFNVFGIVGGFSSGALAQRFRIRRAMTAGFALVAVVLLALGVLFAHLPLWLAFTLPALFLLLHSSGPAPGGMSIAAAAYPSTLRALGSGVTNMAGSAGGVTGLFVFPLIMAVLGPGTTIMLMALVPLAGFLASALIRWDPENPSGGPVAVVAGAQAVTRLEGS